LIGGTRTNKVYAYRRPGQHSAVIDAAVWSALRLDVPLEFLHVLAASGACGPCRLQRRHRPGAQESLLQELSDLDERRASSRRKPGGSCWPVHAGVPRQHSKCGRLLWI